MRSLSWKNWRWTALRLYLKARRFRYSDFTEVVTESRNYMVGFRNQWTKDDARLGGTAE